MKPYYRVLEQELLGVLSELSQTLTSTESAVVQEFVCVGEYGLALETLCGIIVEENKTLSWEAYKRMCRLADRMGMNLDLLEQVRKHVDGSQTAN